MKKSIVLIALLFTANIHAKMVRTMTIVNWAGKYKMSIKTSAGQWIELLPKTYKKDVRIDLDGICSEQVISSLEYYSQFITAQCVKSPCIESGICSVYSGSVKKIGNLTGVQGDAIYLILDAGRLFFGGIERSINQLAKETLPKAFYGSVNTSRSNEIKGLCVGVSSYGNDNDVIKTILKGLKETK